MKVAILTSGFFPVIDGVTVTVYQRVQRLSQLGHQVLLLCPDYRAAAEIYPDWARYVGEILPGVTVLPLASSPFMGLEFDRNVNKSAYPVLLQALAQFQPDIIHVDEPERLQLGFDKIPAVDFAKRHHIPSVAFLHTNFIDYLADYFPLPNCIIQLMQAISQRIVARIYNAYHATLVSSSVTYHRALKLGIKNAIFAELLGVSLAQFDDSLRAPDFFDRIYGIPNLDRKVKLLFLGRLTPDKGWNFTLEALAQTLRSSQQNWLESCVLIVAGDGSMRSELEAKLAALPLTSHFLGRIDPATVPALLINSDIHITASEKETRGLTLLESFAAGIPVLAPAAGGVVDTIQSGHNGFLFQPQNQIDFAAKLQQLVTDVELRQEMGRNAKAAATQYDWNEAIDRLIRLWELQIQMQRQH